MGISILCNVLFVILSIILWKAYKIKSKQADFTYQKEKNKLYQRLQQEKEELERKFDREKQEAEYKQHIWREQQEKCKQELEQRLEDRKQAVEEIIEQLECRRRGVEKSYQDIISNQQEKIEIELEGYRKLRLEQMTNSIKQEFQKRKDEEIQHFQELVSGHEEAVRAKQEELNEITNLLDDYKKKQQVINEAILRQREIEEKQDFYRVKLTDIDKQDIKYLISIVDNIKNSTLLYKLIWSEYIQKPFNTMLKNITGGKEIKCVIYKITNISTQEIYIGKTKADVTKRWTEHIKTSLNIGTVARSKIHEALFKHWDEFTFEILEIIKDETKLSEREKYYINFYQSNIYGYNMNSGE